MKITWYLKKKFKRLKKNYLKISLLKKCKEFRRDTLIKLLKCIKRVNFFNACILEMRRAQSQSRRDLSLKLIFFHTSLWAWTQSENFINSQIEKKND